MYLVCEYFFKIYFFSKSEILFYGGFILPTKVPFSFIVVIGLMLFALFFLQEI